METIFKRKIKEVELSYRQVALLMRTQASNISLIANGRRIPSRKWSYRFIHTINAVEQGRISIPKIRRGRPLKLSTKQN